MTPEHAQLTQEILIHSATWWMTDEEKIVFLTQTIIETAKSATDHDGPASDQASPDPGK